MISPIHQIETNHEELIHDAQADFYGTRLATCSGDCKIKIYELSKDGSKLIDTLHGHEGPVWQLDWSHPEHGSLLASCSYDRKVIIWQEREGKKWEKIKEHKEHDSSVSSVQWAPREFGLMLACGSSDQSISILKYLGENQWESRKIPNAHKQGVNAVSWAPPMSSVSTIYRPNTNMGTNNVGGGANSTNTTTTGMNTSTAISGDATTMLSRPQLVERLVSGGCDNLVKIWKYDSVSDKWIEERELNGHEDWVRDVAWAPSIGLPKWYIASCSQDRRVIIWTKAEGPSGNEWESKVMATFNEIVWHVSWSVMGNILAVSCGENQVSLWKEDMNGDFRQISEVLTQN